MPARATLQLSKMSKINSTQPLSSSPFEAERLNGAMDSDLAHNAFVLCCAKTQEAPATASAAALGTGGLLMGNNTALDGAGDPFAAVEEGFRIAAAPEGVLLRSLNDCLESAEKHLSRLEKLSSAHRGLAANGRQD